MKKAISPIIATLLLILIAVAAAVLVYVWVTGYASSMTKAGAPELEERIKVEAVNVGAGTVTIYVRNIGSTTIESGDLSNMVAYIIDPTSGEVLGTSNSWTKESGDGDRDFEPGEVFSTFVSASLQEGRTYIAKVVTPNGVEAALSFSYQE